MLVLGEHFQHQLIRSCDIRSLSRKRRPAKRSFALAKQRPNVGGHKSRKVVGVLHALLKRKRPNIVSVIKRHRAQLLQIQHSLNVLRHRLHRMFLVLIRIFFSQFERRFERHPVRHVSADRIVRAGLIRQQIGNHAALRQLRNQVRAISNQSNRCCFALAHRVLQNPQRLIQARHQHIDVARLQSFFDALAININAQKRRAIHRRCQRLRSAHPANSTANN